ncbi:MAG: hypothetical protein N5P05_000495 [Chroococcopsis gigantea SAG 12.99]|jgi:hypothetical protein|nr:hypothetical protein [Chlorogloea purpurea SAG 13.99]MDV2998889.1 hypothetical protein [Chroococcopsis gigantea SAG 12.99]
MATPVITTSAGDGIGQFLELANALQAKELDFNAANINTVGFVAENRIAVVYDTEAMTATVTGTVPLVQTQTAAGAKFTAVDYMA